jgi:N-acetylglucosaminyl-diphospho-decaprenol L-rhamnosyltransferase
VRIVVVTYRSADVIGTFLDSLEQAISRPYEVVVVDNSPSVQSELLRAVQRPGVRLLRPGVNLGYGGAANAGARGAGTEWILVANPDVAFAPGAVDTLLAAAESWPQGAAFGPAIVTPDGALYPSARALPSLGRGIGHALAGWWWPSNPWTASYRNEHGAPVQGPVGWLSGACLLVRRSAFERVTGFDPGFFMYFEDVDLGRRLGEAGMRSVYVPDAVVTHLGGHSTSGVARRMLGAHHRSAYRYLARQYSGRRWLPVRVVLAAGLFARYLLGVLFRGPAQGAQPTRRAAVLDPVAATSPSGADTGPVPGGA